MASLVRARAHILVRSSFCLTRLSWRTNTVRNFGFSRAMRSEEKLSNTRPVSDENRSDLDIIRAKLTYRARKRGMLEGDLMLSTFAAKYLNEFNMEQCLEFEELMDEADWDVYYWVIGRKPIPEEWENSFVLGLLQDHIKNKGRTILRMPDL